MPTDYILFIHGVKTHNQAEFERLATILLNRIRASIGDRARDIKPIFCFWGDLNLTAQKELSQAFSASPAWKDFWFRDFRTGQILEFVGDAALYLSRHIGSQVVERLRQNTLSKLKGGGKDDRLHLITHSWGTVILFDILFARRWEDEGLDDDPNTQGVRKTVAEIRNMLFGLPPQPDFGIPLSSIHTMGSPIALFSLLNISGNVDGASTHDFTPRLQDLLRNLQTETQKPLPWLNFAHPGDPIAYPLKGVMSMLLETESDVEIRDVITERGNAFNRPFHQKLLPLLWGGEAHGSYWDNPLVAQSISEVIRSTL